MAGPRWRCSACDHVSTSWAAAERHARTHGHGARIDLVIEPKP